MIECVNKDGQLFFTEAFKSIICNNGSDEILQRMVNLVGKFEEKQDILVALN